MRRIVVVTAIVVGGALVAAGALPAIALAHGPVAPVATSYLAKVGRVPAGLDAKVVDGDLRMWLRVSPAEYVVVLDYRGAPYLRFTPSGVDVNQNSAMYYLNQTPVAETPPANLGRTTPPRWEQASDGREYGWHDGRLHALANVAIAPGSTYVGRWSIPVLVDGHLAAISGGVWHAEDPSIVWFWPIVVLIACVLAAVRLKRPELDARVGRTLGVAALLAIGIAGVGRELHGRPNVTVLQLVELTVILAFVLWGLHRVVARRPGYTTYFVIAFVAVWQGVGLLPTLADGFVLMAVPAFVARIATVLCLGCGVGLLLMTVRLAERPRRRAQRPEPAIEGGSDGDRVGTSVA